MVAWRSSSATAFAEFMTQRKSFLTSTACLICCLAAYLESLRESISRMKPGLRLALSMICATF